MQYFRPHPQLSPILANIESTLANFKIRFAHFHQRFAGGPCVAFQQRPQLIVNNVILPNSNKRFAKFESGFARLR